MPKNEESIKTFPEADESDKVEPGYETLIVRDGYRYILNCKYKDKLFYKCEDKRNNGCKGVWKLYLDGKTQGQIHRPHTEPYENHSMAADREEVKQPLLAESEQEVQKSFLQVQDQQLEANVFEILSKNPNLHERAVIQALKLTSTDE
jgi:hypothetical protein